MDATELSALLEDFRDCLPNVRTGEPAYINILTEIAGSNKVAAKSIVHIIEQYLLKVDPAFKQGAFFVIDSICQKVGEPFRQHFSPHLPKMFFEVWRCGDARGHERMQKWLAHYRAKNIFPHPVLDNVERTLAPAGYRPLQAHAAPSAQPDARAQQWGAAPSSAPPAHASSPYANPASSQPGAMYQPHAAVQRQHTPPHHGVHPGAVPMPYGAPRGPAPTHGMYPGPSTQGGGDALAAYRAAQGQPHNPQSSQSQRPWAPPARPSGPPLPPAPGPRPSHMPHANSFPTSFRSVNLKVFNPIALQHLKECTSKIVRKFTDKRIARELSRRDGRSARYRNWYVPADLWVQGLQLAPTDEAATTQAAAGHGQPEATPEAEHRFFVPKKGNTVMRCAISKEPFEEAWNEDLEEFVYMDAVKLPDHIAHTVGLAPGAIVKISCLDPGAAEQLQQVQRGSVKREREDSEALGQPPAKAAIHA